MGERLPWVALWREESPRFQRLSFWARALFAQLLKATDAEGVVYLAKGCPAAAIGRIFGADKGDRRTIRRVLPELLEAGYLAHDEAACTLTFTGFMERQPDTSGARTGRQRSTKRDRTEHERSAKRTRTEREDPPNPPKSLDPLKESEEEGEKEGEREIPPPPYEPPEATRRRETERRIEETAKALRVAWAEGWQAHTGDLSAPPSHRSVVAGAEVAAHVEAEARARGLDHAAFAAQCVAGFFAGRKAGGRPWPRDFAQDPCKGAARRTQASGGVLAPEARAALESLREAGQLDAEGCALLDAQPPKSVRRGSEPHGRNDDGSRTTPKHLREPGAEAARRDDGHAERRAARRARATTGERDAAPTRIEALL